MTTIDVNGSVRADLDGLKAAALTDVENVERYASLAVVYACRAGGRFLAMKQLVESTTGYGSWGTWLQGNVQLSPRSVGVYMQLAKTLPTLADPTLDAESAMADPAAREIAGLSVRKALMQLAEKAGTAGSRTSRKKKAADGEGEEGGEEQPQGRIVPPEAFAPPMQVLNGWVRAHLPLASDEQRAEIIAEYMSRRSEIPPDGEVFELSCAMWALGQRARPTHGPGGGGGSRRSVSRARGQLKALPNGDVPKEEERGDDNETE